MPKRARAAANYNVLPARGLENFKGWARKSWRTHDGRKVRILCIDAELPCPVVAILFNQEHRVNVLENWRLDGTHPSGLIELLLISSNEKAGG